MTIEEHCIQLGIKREEEYKKFKPVYCPCLKSYVSFNSDGFHHLKYEPSGRARTHKEQIYKLNLLPLVVPVIRNAKKVDEYRTEEVRTSRKKNNPKIKKVEYWSLVEIVGRKCPVKIKVILWRIGNGNINFRSVMKLTK